MLSSMSIVGVASSAPLRRRRQWKYVRVGEQIVFFDNQTKKLLLYPAKRL